MPSTAPENLLRRACLAYAWHEDAFLSRRQAEYALERLWSLVRGAGEPAPELEASLEAQPPAIILPAATREAVHRLHDLEPGTLEWVDLASLLPPGMEASALGLDTERLPALLTVEETSGELTDDTAIHFPLDLVAATFLLLSRWEEHHVAHVPDTWGNFSSTSSLARRQGFLERPVLDEWALVLRAHAERLRSPWRASPGTMRVFLSHDIDRPFKYISGFRVLRAFAGGLVLHRSPRRALRNVGDGLRSRRSPHADPFYRGWEHLLDFADRLGLRSTFFLMSATPSFYDEGYDLTDPAFRPILERIRREGHRIGWHPGYRAGEDDGIFWRERERIDPHVHRDELGVRHHYLRWRGGSSWRRLEEAGVRFDSSLGFNETIGFRCGTSHPFPVYDLESDTELRLVERPLILQDGAIFSFMTDSMERRLERTVEVARRVQAVGGELTILIHNFDLEETREVCDFFEACLEELELTGLPEEQSGAPANLELVETEDGA